MEKELQKFYFQKSSKKLLFFFPSQINFCLRARKSKLKITRCCLLPDPVPPGFPSLSPGVSEDLLLQGFLLPEPLTMAGWGSLPFPLPAYPSRSFSSSWTVVRDEEGGSKNRIPGDTGRACVSCCGVDIGLLGH